MKVLRSRRGTVIHYRLKDVSVRVGKSGILCCLTCRSINCEHVKAVVEWLREKSAERAA